MTDKEIMAKAIDKCRDAGLYKEDQAELIKRFNPHLNYQRYIFSHDFAKAFWGEDKIELGLSMNQEIAWKAHLKEMVLKEEPLKYLERFL